MVMKNILVGLFIVFSVSASAQFDHESVFPDLDNEPLNNALVENYKTSTVLSYSQARDTFFKNIDAVDNVLECVYTGFKINLDPNADPTTDAFGKGINTEHTYPRSKGASENTNAYSDMHHLFPTREGVNSARGNLPFSDIVDSQTDKWYFEDNVITTIPSQAIDDYSELLNNENFEPREKHKGDVARAYFYFYTMYKNQADQEAPIFFESQRETMCKWHFDDPVDEKEWIRNNKIANYQEGKKNPFILDCRLARLYCDDIAEACLIVNTVDVNVSKVQISPNPASTTLIIDSEDLNFKQYGVFSNDGRMIKSGWIDDESTSVQIDIEELKSGFYILRLLDNTGHVTAVSKFVKI
jgi:hypothetical protein